MQMPLVQVAAVQAIELGAHLLAPATRWNVGGLTW
jgi:hypothetical protein